MSDLVSHIQQAQHNEGCANYLLEQNTEYIDWSITAAFYAAVHLAEASFATRGDIQHTESAPDRAGEEKHSYRSRKVQELANPAHISYRKLQNASYDLRYLAGNAKDFSKARKYYSRSVALGLVQRALPTVRDELAKAFGVRLT